MNTNFLPMNPIEMKERGITQPDFVYICGDAYVDHPSFGHAIISRVLEAHGFSVVMLCQPDYRDQESVTIFGEPKLGFLVSAGNMDSMVNHYTVNKKRRSTDAYSPGGKAGIRPDYATIVYCNLIRRTYKKTPIIIGGIEASLRRMAHYDYWSDRIRRSILLESGADLISYGMGEKSIVAIAEGLQSGLNIRDLTFIPGTVFKTRNEEDIYDAIRLPSFEEIQESKESYAKSFYIQYQNTDSISGRRLYESYDNKMFVVQNPPSEPLSVDDMDDIYALPYVGTYHPSYKEFGGIPAISEIKFSLTSNRGCFGACNFCALTFHQGRMMQRRSKSSLVNEAERMTRLPDFKGYIHDVGGPTANFLNPACKKQIEHGVCTKKQCLTPVPCKNLNVDHSEYLDILRSIRNLPKVKKVFIRSGIRFDYLMLDKDPTFLKEVCKYHVSGQLRVAPEHISNNVLDNMGKPHVEVYNAFLKEFDKTNQRLGQSQYAIPYLMSSHPGSTLKDAIALAEYIRDMGYIPEQVQDFYPTPSTISTCMYYTGLDPRTLKKVYVPKDPHEKAMQRALIQYKNPDNYELVKEALRKEGREDLIGFGPNCLIPPRNIRKTSATNSSKGGKDKNPAMNSAGKGKSKKTGVNSADKGKSKKTGVKPESRSKHKYTEANKKSVDRQKKSKSGSNLSNKKASGGKNKRR